MASSSKIHLTPSNRGVFSVANLSPESADRASKLLQENHEKHHIFFNKMGFHNHIAHHLLTVFALGASPEAIQRHYDSNASYQRPPQPIHRDIIDHKLGDPTEFKKYLGNERYYHDYLLFFQKEMSRLPKGYKDVIHEYLLKGDDRANDLLGRLYNGILHPIIHLGFGVEFEQPAIIAEALAQAAVHSDWLKPFLLDTERASAAKQQRNEPSKTLVQLLHAVQADRKLSSAPHWEDGNKLRDGVFARAYDEMIEHAASWYAQPTHLEAKTAEMYDFCAFFAGAAQRPEKEVKFDFFHIHSLNCAIFFTAFLKQDWLTDAHKVRLLEWKARVDLAEYVRCGLARLDLGEIDKYQPKEPGKSSWEQVFGRVNAIDDDGHAAKLVRTLAQGQRFVAPFEAGKHDLQVRGEAWRLEGNMAIDSVGHNDDNDWVRSCGFEQAWESIPDRAQSRL